MIEPILALGGLTTLYIIGKDDKIKGDEKGEEVYKQKRNPVGFTKSVHKAVNMVTFSDKTIPSEFIIFTFFKDHFSEVISAEAASILLIKLFFSSNS